MLDGQFDMMKTQSKRMQTLKAFERLTFRNFWRILKCNRCFGPFQVTIIEPKEINEGLEKTLILV